MLKPKTDCTAVVACFIAPVFVASEIVFSVYSTKLLTGLLLAVD
jgi:hypothetical protein